MLNKQNIEKLHYKNFNLNDAVLIVRSSGATEMWVITEKLNEYDFILRPNTHQSSMYREENLEELQMLNPNGPNVEATQLLKSCSKLYYQDLSEILFSKNSGLKEYFEFQLHNLTQELDAQLQKNRFYSDSHHFYKEYFETLKQELINERRNNQEYNKIKNELYPNGIDSDFKQGDIGTCYLLAALKSIKSHPEIMEFVIRKSIKKINEKTWSVQFLGDYNNIGPIIVNQDKLNAWQKKSQLKASLGDIILETAYGSFISRSGGNKSRTMLEDHSGKIAVEGGYQHRTLAHILGPIGQKCILQPHRDREEYRTFEKAGDDSSTEDFFIKKYPLIKDNIALTASTEPDKKGDYAYKMIEGIKLSKQHAYTIMDFKMSEEPENQRVVISNPHNSKSTFSLSLKSFNQAFANLRFNKIDHITKLILQTETITNNHVFQKIITDYITQKDIYKTTCSTDNLELIEKLLYNYELINDQNKKKAFKNAINQYLFNNQIDLNISELLISVKNIDNKDYITNQDLEYFKNELEYKLQNTHLITLANSYYSSNINQQNEVQRTLKHQLSIILKNTKDKRLQKKFMEIINTHLRNNGYNFQISLAI